MLKQFQNIIKKNSKILIIIAIILVVCGVLYYLQNKVEKYAEFFEEDYEEEDYEEDKEDKEDNKKTEDNKKPEDSSVKKYAFITEKTCEESGHLQIKDSKTCEAAAKQLDSGWKYKFKEIEDSFEATRPKGCAKHPIGNLDFFGEGKSTGAANVTGYSGVYCIKKGNVEEKDKKYGFDKWFQDRQDNLNKAKNLNCEDIGSVKKMKYEKIMKKLSKRNKLIEDNLRKINDKIDKTNDNKKKEKYGSIKKNLQARQTKILEITGKTQEMINSVTKAKTEDKAE